MGNLLSHKFKSKKGLFVDKGHLNVLFINNISFFVNENKAHMLHLFLVFLDFVCVWLHHHFDVCG